MVANCSAAVEALEKVGPTEAIEVDHAVGLRRGGRHAIQLRDAENLASMCARRDLLVVKYAVVLLGETHDRPCGKEQEESGDMHVGVRVCRRCFLSAESCKKRFGKRMRTVSR
jgi:hypothetical protein